ncbi:protein of unknown function [Streptomyces sp. KY75]|nr:protein of unknown function [Streptomyces sp. KY70]CAD5987294.1 protein of unknown function [Streptomyces sp. KY75]
MSHRPRIHRLGVMPDADPYPSDGSSATVRPALPVKRALRVRRKGHPSWPSPRSGSISSIPKPPP